MRTGPDGRMVMVKSPAAPSTLSRSMLMVPRSPFNRKRGKVVVSTTGSRITTSETALPTFVALQATAMTRAVPANSGMAKGISADPSAPTVTMPE